MAISNADMNDIVKWYDAVDSVKTSTSDNTGGYWVEYPYNDIPLTWDYFTSGYLSWDENIKDTEVFDMQVYNVIIIDTKKCEVVQNYANIVAENEKMAMLELQLKESIKEAHKKGQIAFIFVLLGGFNRYTRKVQIKDEED